MKKIKITLVIIISLNLSLMFTPDIRAASFKIKVVTEQANIRLEPDIGSAIIRQVSQGTILESTAKENES